VSPDDFQTLLEYVRAHPKPIIVWFASVLSALIIGFFTHVLTSRRENKKLRAENRRLEVAYQRDDDKIHREQHDSYRARFNTAAEQLSNLAPSVRRAGITDMANLAEEWPDHRGQCVNELCAYARQTLDGTGEAQVRRFLVQTFQEHLRGKRITWTDHPHLYEPGSWSELRLDLGGATFAHADFEGCVFGEVDFHDATFTDRTSFDLTQFLGEKTQFDFARFTAESSFALSRLNSRQTSFTGAQFSGTSFSGSVADLNVHLDFTEAQFNADAAFERTHFSGSTSFRRATFLGEADFDASKYPDGSLIDFREAQFFGPATFNNAQFAIWQSDFEDAVFHKDAYFVRTAFTGEKVDFEGVEFRGLTSFYDTVFKVNRYVLFNRASFSGDHVHFCRIDFGKTPRVALNDVKFSCKELEFGPWLDKVGEVEMRGAVFPLDTDLGWTHLKDARIFSTAAQPPTDLSHVRDRFTQKLPIGIRHPSLTLEWGQERLETENDDEHEDA
jgi:uncharacterized protein YjbI with pentapeptide repeats